MRALFVTTVSPETGMGHLMRCAALAEQLSSLGWRAELAVRRGEAVFAGRLSSTVIELDLVDKVAASDLRRVGPDGVDVLVIDDYGRGAAAETCFRNWARRIIVLDDCADRAHDCDVLIDPTPGRSPDDYRRLVGEYCRVLTGPDYALLPPEFVQLRPATRERRGKGGPMRRLLVSMGGTDPHDVTSRVLEAVLPALPGVAADVVLGASAPHVESVRHLVAAHAGVSLHVDTRRMAELMAAADLAVGAPGGTSWERCALGLPTIVITVADNQRLNASALASAGAALDLGWHADVSCERIAESILELRDSHGRRQAMAACAAAVCDGRGTFRALLALLLPVRALDGRPVRLRAAEMADGAIMLDWQRHPTTRRYVRNPAVPDEDEHYAWLAGKLADPDCLFAVIEYDGIPAGVLRLDRCEGTSVSFEVSILTAPDLRGLGIAAAALSLARQAVPGADLVAEVMEPNRASAALFRSQGYSRGDDGMYRLQGAQVH